MLRPALHALLTVPMIAAATVPAAAQSAADFYKGRTIQMIIGVSAGGDYDLRARLRRALHVQVHPGKSKDRSAKHAGCGRPGRGELAGERRAARRHRDARDLI